MFFVCANGCSYKPCSFFWSGPLTTYHCTGEKAGKFSFTPYWKSIKDTRWIKMAINARQVTTDFHESGSH